MLSRKGLLGAQGWLRRNAYLLLGATVWSAVMGASLYVSLELDRRNIRDLALSEAGMVCEFLTRSYTSLMTRQVHDFARADKGLRGHITGLISISPRNRPDDWEKEALRRLAAGVAETSEVADMDGRSYFRLPVYAVLPECRSELSEAYTNGKLLSAKSNLCRQIGLLVERVAGTQAKKSA